MLTDCIILEMIVLKYKSNLLLKFLGKSSNEFPYSSIFIWASFGKSLLEHLVDTKIIQVSKNKLDQLAGEMSAYGAGGGLLFWFIEVMLYEISSEYLYYNV